MSFLDLFKKKPQGPKINVRVWMNLAAKEKACIRMAQAESTLIFIAWSKVTSDHFQAVFEKQGIPNEMMTAREVIPTRMAGKNFVFLERHFDHDKEKKFLEALKSNDVLVHVSLSDPLLAAFNADRIQKMMEKMGLNESEFIEHEMINKSIERAMEKIKNSNLHKDSPKTLLDWIEGIV